MQKSGIYPTASQSMLLPDPSFEFVEISLSASLTEVEWHLQKESILASVRNWKEIYFRRCDRATRRKERNSKKVLYGPLAPIASLLFQCISNMEYSYFERKWRKQGFPCQNPDKAVSEFTRFSMKDAPKPLLIPHMTQIDGNHFAMGKVPNLYVARTEKVRSIGWDNNIRMLDHQDFFWRASGNLVTVITLGTAVFHYHNPFQRYYQQF